MFQVSFVSRAEKEFGRLPKKLQQKIYDELKEFSEGGFFHSKIRKVKGTDFGYCLRLGRWRILFALFSKKKRIEVVDIFLKKGKEDYQKRKSLLG